MAPSHIKVGETIPEAQVKEDSPVEKKPLDLSGTNIIVGVPGAFTGTCHAQVPGYIENLDKFKSKGVKAIYIVAVNDVFVTKAWKESLKGTHLKDLHFIADDNAALTASLNLTFHAPPLGGLRSLRYALVADNGKVKSIVVEPDSGKLDVTAAEKVLNSL